MTSGTLRTILIVGAAVAAVSVAACKGSTPDSNNTAAAAGADANAAMASANAASNDAMAASNAAANAAATAPMNATNTP
jgi:hypothetical protein